MKTSTSDIYGVGPAARYVGVTEATMRRYADQGAIPSKRDATGNRLFLFEDLVSFVKIKKKTYSAGSNHSRRRGDSNKEARHAKKG